MSNAKPIVTIECYDSGVRICDGENILADTTSCALIEDNHSITVGKSAQQQAHLRPREVSISYWSNLTESSITKHVISNAELALYHLQHVWQLANCENDAIIITPASYEKQALGILLGICEKLSINIVGMVCNAALAMQRPISNCKAVYLDILQQNLITTELKQNASNIEMVQPSHVFEYGLQNFLHNLAKTVANKFVAETRFDPLHTANHEQLFFDKLPLWLNDLNESETTNCTLLIEDKEFSIELNQQELHHANGTLFEEIAGYLSVLFHSRDLLAIYCSPSCSQIFGFFDFMSTLPGCAIEQLNEIELSKHALCKKQEIVNQEQVHYVKKLSCLNNTSSESLIFNPGTLSNLFSIPTHILIEGHAYSLKQDIFIANSASSAPRVLLEETTDCICKISNRQMYVEVEALNSKSININQNAVNHISSTKVGDLLSMDDGSINCQFIKVVNHEA